MTGLYAVPQTDPPRSPRETLPTMYDLPSEEVGEPGLPDEYHDLQAQLLSRTFRPPTCAADRRFTVSDMNLYYDVHHPRWYKRPDWFAVIGVPRLYDRQDLRLSYVIWQEGVTPIVVVELLSPGTEAEDLGPYAETTADISLAETNEALPPPKWQVYETILRIPYYVVFSRYTDQMRVFIQNGGHYREQVLDQPKIWIPELAMGLGLWRGEFAGITRSWLRWYDEQGNWMPTDTDEAETRAEQAETRAEQAEQQLADLRERLRQRGLDPDTL